MRTYQAILSAAGAILVSSAAYGAGFDLSVSATTNCFDLQNKSIPGFATHHIENGRYVVNVRSTNANYCGGPEACRVPKLTIYITTEGNPRGWFNQVEALRPIVIDVTGDGADANTVYAFYTDLICGDNVGGAVLGFRSVSR